MSCDLVEKTAEESQQPWRSRAQRICRKTRLDIAIESLRTWWSNPTVAITSIAFDGFVVTVIGLILIGPAIAEVLLSGRQALIASVAPPWFPPTAPSPPSAPRVLTSDITSIILMHCEYVAVESGCPPLAALSRASRPLSAQVAAVAIGRWASARAREVVCNIKQTTKSKLCC